MKNLKYIVFLFCIYANAQQLAFDTAYGAGAYTTGGRGGTVYHVTSLLDDGSVGTLRDALSVGNRTIVFDVSGVIQLTSILGFTSNITIAGQTAPEGGITIDGQRVYVSDINNLIVRHIRFKGGVDGGDDSVTVRGNVTNQIWDHCSFSFGIDEAASWYETEIGKTVDNITIQRCLFSENSKGSIVGGGTGTTTTGDISFNFNLFYNNSHRFPNSSGDNANVEVINNVVWSVSSRLVRVNGNGHNLNHIGNYYDFGTRGMVDDRLHMYSYETGYPNIYTIGNKIVAQSPSTPLTSTASQMNTDNKLAWKHFIDATSTPQGTRNKGNQLEDEYFIDTQHALLGSAVTILTADQALVNVSADVGCNARLNADGSISDNKDTLDTTALTNVVNGIYTDKLLSSSYNVSPITSVARGGTYDTDNDGMADTWETATFGDLTRTGALDFDADGYTDLEEFLNLVDGVIAVVSPISVTTTPDAPTINMPNTVQLGVTYNPTNTTNKTGVWLSSNTGVATVSSGGLVTPISAGTSTITYTANALDSGSGTVSDTNLVTVTNTTTAVTSVDVTPNTSAISSSADIQMNVSVLPIDASDKTGVWSSNNTGVATVNSSGLVTVLSSGTVSIIFTANDATNSAADTSIFTITLPTGNLVSSSTNSSFSDIKETLSGTAFNSTWESYDKAPANQALINGTYHEGLNIPIGKTIKSANVTFKALASDTGAATIYIYAQKGTTPTIFNGALSDVGNRPLTTAFATWTPTDWVTGNDYITADISTVIQEVIDDASYTQTDPIVLVYKQPTGTIAREAESYDTDPTNSPLLTVNYNDSAVNIPVITLIGGSTITLESGSTYSELGATATDVEDGSLTVSIVVSGVGNGSLLPFNNTYYVYYNVTDSSGNNAVQVIRTLNVITSNINYTLSDRQKRTSKRIIKNKLIRI